jgi:hypothetical protein
MPVEVDIFISLLSTWVLGLARPQEVSGGWRTCGEAAGAGMAVWWDKP